MSADIVVHVSDLEAGTSVKGFRVETQVGDAKLLKDEKPRDISRDLYCFVLGTGKHGAFKTEEEANTFRQELVNDLSAAGLDCTLFYSTQEDEIYIRVGTDDKRLLEEADHIEYSLELDPDAMKIIAESDKCLPERRPIFLEAPFDRSQRIQSLGLLGQWNDMSDDEVTKYIHHQTHVRPFDYLHARYNDEWEKYGKEKFGVQIYKVYPSNTILRTADRMKLIQIIMERSKQEDVATGARGAGLNLSELVLKKKILAVFPLQNTLNSEETGEPTVDALFDKWNRLFKLPWHQPLDEIRDYFGEKIALYFAFLGHYTMWLFGAAVVGVAVFIHQLSRIDQNVGSPNLFAATELIIDNSTGAKVVVYSEVPEAPFFALFIAFWATFMLEFWKRKQAWFALKWGTSNFEATEVVRPEFTPSHFLPSPVTGRSEPYYSFRTFLVKVLSSLSIILICIGVVISAIAGIFVFKVFVSIDPAKTGLDQESGTQVALVINAVVIIILGNVYKAIARKLNEWENYRTDTQFEDSLIAKTFVFCFVNSYATLFYLAFIKSGTVILGQEQLCEPAILNVNGTKPNDACFGALGTSLLIVFLVQLIVNNTLEIGIPTITETIKKIVNTRTPKVVKNAIIAEEEAEPIKIPKMRSPCEDQFYKKSYEGTFDDFLEIALQFGYVTLFVAAFPLAPVLAFINNMVEVRVDSFKLCKLCRRPVNFGAQDIGTWQTIYYLMGLVAVMTNAGVIFFTSHIIVIESTNYISEDALRVWAWVISVLGVLACKWLADFLLPDVPTEVQIQLKREDYIVRKCLLRERDDELDDDVKKDVGTSKEIKFKIHKVDPSFLKIVQGLSEVIKQKYGSLAEGFKAADRNHDGQVSKREFTRLLKGIEGIYNIIPEDEIKIIIDCLDYNNNNKIEYEEFLRLGSPE